MLITLTMIIINNMNHKAYTIITFAFIVIFSMYFANTAVADERTSESTSSEKVGERESSDSAVFCTMDAKQCSDGSWVSRVAPSCDFAACPRSSDKDDDDGDKESAQNNDSDEVIRDIKDTDDNEELYRTTYIKIDDVEGEDERQDDKKRVFIIPKIDDLEIDESDIEDEHLRGIDGDDDDESEASTTASTTKRIIRVRGDEVRGWDQKTKEAVIARLEANDEKNDNNDFGLFVAMQAVAKDKIKDITVQDPSDEESEPVVSVSYIAKIKLFGLFEREVPAIVSIYDDESIKTTFDTSLFVRLLSTKINRAELETVANTIKTKHDAVMNSIRNVR